MRFPIIVIMIILCTSGCVSVGCQRLAQQDIAPELKLRETDFTYEEYSGGLEFIDNVLDSYYKDKKPGWEIENIGIPNSLLKLKGYGLYSQREIIRLKLENAKLKGASKQDIERLNKSLRDIEHKIKVFLSGNIWVD